MRGGDPDNRGHVVSGKPVLPTQGETGPSRHEKGQVLPAGGERAQPLGWLDYPWLSIDRLLCFFRVHW